MMAGFVCCLIGAAVPVVSFAEKPFASLKARLIHDGYDTARIAAYFAEEKVLSSYG